MIFFPKDYRGKGEAYDRDVCFSDINDHPVSKHDTEFRPWWSGHSAKVALVEEPKDSFMADDPLPICLDSL
jgi:hypothetical protein